MFMSDKCPFSVGKEEGEKDREETGKIVLSRC